MAVSVKPKALINAGGPRTTQTSADGKVMIAAVKQELCRCPSNMALGLELPQARVLKILSIKILNFHRVLNIVNYL